MNHQGQFFDAGLQQLLDSHDFSFDPSLLEAEPAYHYDPTFGGRRTPTGASIMEADAIVGEDGRTYHGYSQGSMYYMPNDGPEQDRLDLQHKMFKLILDGKLALAPIDTPSHVLDLATGTGIWAIELAELYPNAHVVGTDLSKIQPVERAPNCEFIREDSETQEWIFPYTFDYIHTRACITCFDSFEPILRKSYDFLTPGGWLEIQDFDIHPFSMDGTLHGTALEEITRALGEGLSKLGRSASRVYQYKDWMIEKGFTDVVEKVFPFPASDWVKDPKQKRIGRYSRMDIGEVFGGMRRLILLSGRSEARSAYLEEQVKKDLANMSIHGIFNLVCVYGRKPIDQKSEPVG